MRPHFFVAVRLTLVCIVFFCVVYPLIVLGIARFAPSRGEGETVRNGDNVVGYALEGQAFTSDRYFIGRPSTVAYNAAGSGGSNKGTTNPDYLKSVKNNVDSFLAHNPGIPPADLPSELVTASGSGLDPDISRAAALVQVKRIARQRSVAEGKLTDLVVKHVEHPFLGILGPEKINVLALNIDLDKTFGK